MRTTLGHIATIRLGHPFRSADFVDEGVRLLRGDNIAPGSLRWEGAAHWATASPREYLLQDGDVVLAMDRPWIAAGLKFARVRESDLPALLVQRVAALRAVPGVDQGFIEAVVRDPKFSAYVQSIQTGTAVPHISGRQIGDYPVRLPGRPEQRAIAQVLGALDDKIAANSNLSRTLNDLAAEYFSQSVQAAGEGPTYGNIADVFGGGTPSTKIDEYWGGEIRWATPTDVTALEAPYLEDTSRHLTSAGLAACVSELHPAGSILMTSRATIGAFALAGGPTAVNQGFIVVRPKDSQLDMWLFHEMQSRVSDYLAVANGATFLELSRGRFKTMPVRWAPEDVMRQFGAIARPLHGRARAAMHESRSLVTLRNTLLPELMSGRLTVKDAERAVEEAL